MLLSIGLASTVFSACADEEDRVPVSLSWQLADGRDCAEAGIVEVEVTVTAASTAGATFTCEDGLAPATVDLGAFERGVIELEVVATSASAEPLYEADGRIELRGDEVSSLLELEFAP